MIIVAPFQFVFEFAKVVHGNGIRLIGHVEMTESVLK